MLPLGPNVVHIPPPVTCGFPGFKRKVPVPVKVTFDPSFASADPIPPAVIVGGLVNWVLIMSQRTVGWLARATPPVIHNDSDTTAISQKRRLPIFIGIPLNRASTNPPVQR